MLNLGGVLSLKLHETHCEPMFRQDKTYIHLTLSPLGPLILSPSVPNTFIFCFTADFLGSVVFSQPSHRCSAAVSGARDMCFFFFLRGVVFS